MIVEYEIPCPDHIGSNCCVKYSAPNYPVVKSLTRCLRKYKDKDSMLASVYAEIIACYFVASDSVYEKKKYHENAYLDFYRKYYTSSSALAIRPPIHIQNKFVESEIYPTQVIRPIVKELSEQYLFETCNLGYNFEKGSLTDRMYKMLSWEHIIYEPFSFRMDFKGNFPPEARCRVAYSTNNLSATKKIRLMSEYKNNTAYRGDGFHTICRLMPSALECLYKVLECDKYVGTVDLEYSPLKFLSYVKLTTGGGIMPTPTGTTMHNGVKTYFHNTGKKLFMIEACMRYFHRWIMSVFKGKPIPFVDFEIIRAKQEWRKELEELDEESLTSLHDKMREFFIPSLPMIFLSDVLYADRMVFERGNVIRVGMKFWHGGAYELAKYMNYDVPDLFWADGDISKIDKNIQDFFLMAYVACGSRYFNWESYDEQSANALTYLIKTLMYHISHKVVLHLGTYWRFMRGVMYSGGKETSHGDSWILGLIFFLYISSVADECPSISNLIFTCVNNGFIRIVIYGDDHIWCCPKLLRSVINVKGFAQFLQDIVQMSLRAYKEYDSFLSIPNYVTGELSVAGPKFLKRYFVVSNTPDLAPVLPFKPLKESMVNMMTNKNDSTPVEILLSAIGGGWDNMGTNEVAYRYASLFF